MRSFALLAPRFGDVLHAVATLCTSSNSVRAVSDWSAAMLAAALSCTLLPPLQAMALVPTTDAAPSMPQSEQVTVVAEPPTPRRAEPPGAKASTGKAHSGTTAKPSSARSATPERQSVQAPRQDEALNERLVWDKAPLQIALGIGPAFERSITFPAQMHIGVPPEVASLLRVQTVGRTTYVTALGPFARTRVVAEDRASGSVVLLDLTASADTTSTQPVTIVTAAGSPPQGHDTNSSAENAPVDIVTLTRFAAQQMYAPRRLAPAHPAIRRVAVDTRANEDLYAGGGVRATPSAQWRGDGHYVTAVVLRNLREQPMELDPRQVRGQWRAITFQHGRLHRFGSETDTTVVYLVCERPFDACR